MGCNVHLFLPTDVSSDDAAKVIGILAGLPKKLEQFQKNDGHFVNVEGANNEATNCAGMASINIKAADGKKLVDGDSVHTCFFHYASRRNGKIWNSLSPTSTPFWCAVAKELVVWFGGIVEYNDCGSSKAPNVWRSKRFCPVDKFGLVPDDGEAWENYQTELMKMNPVTSLAIRKATKVAAYARSFESDGITERKSG